MRSVPTKMTTMLFSVALLAATVFDLQPLDALAQTTTTTGTGLMNKIWYSKNTFFAGENVRIYAAFQNNSGFDLVGKIQFYDNDNLISETNFNVINGRLVEKWADWKAAKGIRDLKVQIIDTKKSLPGQTLELIELPETDKIITDRRKIDEYIESKKNTSEKTATISDNSAKTELGQTFNSFVPAGITDKISFATGPINTGVIGQVVAVLEEKRAAVGKAIESNEADKTAQPIFWKTLNKLSKKYPQMQKAAQSLPSADKIQYSFLSILSFILKTPWALALAGIAGLSVLWKLTKIFA